MPFNGVTDGKTIPLGQIELPIMFGERDNFCTENIVFDVAHFDLLYNTILGHPALAKFMAAVHYVYSTVKIPGPSGVISVKADVKGSVHCAEKLYEAMAAVSQMTANAPSYQPILRPGSGSPPMTWPSPRRSASETIPRRR
ncbi:uncharacterized protein LOC112899460 [Panicum hallii]|uniref:uncharacterized protein LOC112899460 n=1 Tax=Panicum hallii TaxID=206008 RepID=UPI000DF4E577|nr:uncharacterized protein LOC112899460 [Panicum hallii]